MPSTYRISVLGPVRAWRDQQELPLGPPQQRGILALFAVAGGAPVPVWSLIEELWPADPPPSAVNTIQTYVKRLRRLLDPDRPPRTPSALLPSGNGGYALRIAPEAVDLWRFRELIVVARAARSRGDHQPAREALRQALALWHGPPASDVPAIANSPQLQAVAEERWSAVGWFAEAALHTGAGAEALPIVRQAAIARPFDEPLHAYLIRLYHSVGRRSEAVQVYQHCRHRLDTELGLTPGPELQQAYRDVLYP